MADIQHDETRNTHRISTNVEVVGDSFTIEYFRGAIFGRDKIEEYVDIDNGCRYDDFRGFCLDSLDDAKKLHEALGAIIRNAEFYKASLEEDE